MVDVVPMQINPDQVQGFLKCTELQRILLQEGARIGTRARAHGVRNVSVTVTPNGGIRRDRAEAVITNHDTNAAPIEFGNSRSRARRPMRRAVE